MMRRVLATALLIAAGPALAAERGYTVGGFDRVRIAGPIDASIRVGGGTIVRAEGDARVVDRLQVRVENRVLIVRPDSAGGPITGRLRVTIAMPAILAATLEGSGSLAIDRVRGDRFDLIGNGSGRVSVGRIEVNRLTAKLDGSGGATLAGRVDFARTDLRGSGDLAAGGLQATALELSVAGAGNAVVAATRTALVVARGAGDATVTGTPACTVRAGGSGTVRCGRQSE